MPVAKPKSLPESGACCQLPGNHNFHGYGCNQHHAGKKIILTLVGVLLAYGIIYVGSLIRNSLQQFYFIGQAPKSERTIVVEADGKVTATPDVAVTTMGMVSQADTVSGAQQKNTEVMNSLIDRLKKLGIDPKDLQTANYNVYPQYKYKNDGTHELSGYEISQNVTVKIRDISKANTVLALAGEVGANTVSGLQFTIDDPEIYRDEARHAAIEKIAARVKQLREELGVRFVRVYSYNESEGGVSGPIMYTKEVATGMGGDAAPSIASGSNDVVLHVGVVFEIQ